MSDNTWNWNREYLFATGAAEAKQILEELLAQLNAQHWDESDVFSVHLAVEEALMNAIKHGNQLDSSKQVHVIAKVGNDRVVVEVTDEGEGFEPEDVPDPTADENLENPSGRGLMLMRCYMSTVEFNAVGNQVRMQKLKTAG